MKIKQFFGVILSLVVCFSLLGCEAFVKKFTRKPKNDNVTQEMVLAPVEYPSVFANNEEAYRTYFLYWKSWQDELLTALSEGASQKKQLSCIDEAVKNLSQSRSLLTEEKQKQLDLYIKEMGDLRNAISADPYSNNRNINRTTAERLKLNILRDFSYPDIKGYLK